MRFGAERIDIGNDPSEFSTCAARQLRDIFDLNANAVAQAFVERLKQALFIGAGIFGAADNPDQEFIK